MPGVAFSPSLASGEASLLHRYGYFVESLSVKTAEWMEGCHAIINFHKVCQEEDTVVDYRNIVSLLIHMYTIRMHACM